jgi:hypothetical protein
MAGAILHPVDRIMELLFCLLMALSFTGASRSRRPGPHRDPRDVHRRARLQPRLGHRRRR